MSNIHKAFILGAGLGTRLKPLTDSLPKPLVPLYHEPMVNYALRHCQSVGIDSFAINTHHIPEQWEKHYPEHSFNGSDIAFFYEEVLLETGGGIKNIEGYIGTDPLLVYNGDILTDLDLAALMTAHKASDNVATLALFPTGPNCNVAVEGDRIVDMRNARGIHQFTGIYCINPEILELIPANEKVSIVPAFLELAEQGKLGAFVSETASWHDLGSRESYFEAHEILREKSISIHPDAEIALGADVCSTTCVVGPHAKIGAGAKLRDTIVWPNAEIKPNTKLNGCIVRATAEGIHSGKDL